MPTTVTITVKASKLRRIMQPRKLDELLKDAMAELAADAEVVFASYALHRTGQMARDIHTVKDGKGLTIEVEARNPTTGFDYVRITRFGHRTHHIVPKRTLPAFREAVVVTTGRTRGRGRAASLRFVVGGDVLYRKSTRGFHPATDWASDAMPTVRQVANKRMGDLSKKIVVAWDS